MPRTNLIVIFFVLMGILTMALTFLFLTTRPNYDDFYEKETKLIFDSGQEPPTSSDFMSPVLNLYNKEPQYYLFRKKLTAWDKTQVQQYWIKPKEIIINLLSGKNDKQMEEFLKKIP